MTCVTHQALSTLFIRVTRIKHIIAPRMLLPLVHWMNGDTNKTLNNWWHLFIEYLTGDMNSVLAFLRTKEISTERRPQHAIRRIWWLDCSGMYSVHNTQSHHNACMCGDRVSQCLLVSTSRHAPVWKIAARQIIGTHWKTLTWCYPYFFYNSCNKSCQNHSQASSMRKLGILSYIIE